jgi:hypothetical protein
VSLDDVFREGKAIGGVEKDFDGAGKGWGSVVCMAGISLEDFACVVVESADGHTAHEEGNEEGGCVWDYVVHGAVVFSNGVGVVEEGIEVFGEEKGGDLGLEGVEEVSKVLEDGNQVVEVQKAAGVVAEGEGAAIDVVLEESVGKLATRYNYKYRNKPIRWVLMNANLTMAVSPNM